MSEWTDVAPAPSSSYHPNVAKFLGVLGQAEGAGYGTIVGGSQFNNYTGHPRVVGLRTADGPSTAAGRYQITKTTYDDIAKKLGITDFSPASQDKIAIQLIKDKGAYDDVMRGDYNAAMQKLGGVWASLPSSKYNQPKLTQEQFNKMANQDDGWTTVAPAMKQSPSSDDGWTTVAPAAGPKAAPAVTQQEAPKKEEPKSWLRTIDDAVRGVADTLTFGYADEIAAKMDQLTGGGQSGKTNYEEALAAQRQRDKEGGGARIAGQVAGALVPGAGVIGAIQAPANATRLGRAAAGAGTGAVQGALYGSGSAEGDLGSRAEGALTGGAVGAAAGGVLGGLLPASRAQKVSGEINKAGGEAEAALNAEIAQRALQEFDAPSRVVNGKVKPLGAQELNQKVTNSFIREAKDIVDTLPKDFPNKKTLLDAISRGKNISQAELERVRTIEGGAEVADAIYKAQRADAMTAALGADKNLFMDASRKLVQKGLPGIIADPILQVLNRRQTREQVGKGVVKNLSPLAEDILQRTGPSQATQSLEKLQGIAQKAQAANQSKIEAAKAAREAGKAAAKKAENNPNVAIAELQGKDPTYLLGLSNPNGVPRNQEQMAEFSKVIREQILARQAKQEAAKLAQKGGEQVLDTRAGVLRATRTPLGGPFQELLQGGRSGLNLTTDEAVKGLRILEKKTNDPVLKDAIQRIRSSSGETPGAVPDPNAFYGVQNAMRRLQEQGVLSSGQPGALTAASTVRNPISYAANVRNAEQAAAIAESSAPSKALAQFARKVAGTKSIADKEALIASRMKKATPDEAAYLEQFVSPLTSFGKK